MTVVDKNSQMKLNLDWTAVLPLSICDILWTIIQTFFHLMDIMHEDAMRYLIFFS